MRKLSVLNGIVGLRRDRKMKQEVSSQKWKGRMQMWTDCEPSHSDASAFFHYKGIVHYEFIEHSTTVNQHCYFKILKWLQTGTLAWKWVSLDQIWELPWIKGVCNWECIGDPNRQEFEWPSIWLKGIAKRRRNIYAVVTRHFQEGWHCMPLHVNFAIWAKDP